MLLEHFRLAARSLRRSPAFAIAAILTLGLGIAATTTLISVVYGVLLKPLPYPDADRIVHVHQVGEDGGEMNFSGPNFEDVRDRTRSFEAIALLGMTGTSTVLGGTEPVHASVVRVSRGFLDVLGVRPLHGRGFLPEEQVTGGSRAVLVSQAYWERYLGGRTDLRDETLTFEGEVYPVIGVLPEGLGYPATADLLIPHEASAAEQRRTGHNFRVIGRLADGVDMRTAQQELSSIAAELKQIHRDDTWMSDVRMSPLRDEIVGAVRPALLVLLGAAAFLLLIAGANVANLLLTRATAQRRELAVRLALGAPRYRLVQSAVAEALILTLAATAIGVLIAFWGLDLLRAIAPANLPRAEEIRIDAAVLALVLSGAVLTAVVLGGIIGARGMGGGFREALSERRSGGSGVGGSARAVLVTAQLALTTVLLIGAVLLGRSFMRLLAVDTGFRTSDAVVLSLASDWPEDETARLRQLELHDQLFQRLAAIPGVAEVGGISGLPLHTGFSNGNFLLLRRPDEVQSFDDFEALARVPSRVGSAEYRVASPRYFPAMGIPLVRGRLFDDRDHADAPHVALVSETLAQRTWPGHDPLGRLIQFGNMDGDVRAFTVIGVVGDVRDGGHAGERKPTFYANSRQRIGGASSFEVVIHGSAAPETVIPAVRGVLRELAPELPPRIRTLEEIAARTVAQRRFSLIMFGVFGAAALLLAIIGLYGVVSYSVAQRTHEIGVRTALGAQAANVTALVVRQGAVMASIGIASGLLGAFALTRLLSGLLFGITATDPLAYGAVALLLGTVALLASYIPARRATRVDPIIALRAE